MTDPYEDIKKEWITIQDELKKQIILDDSTINWDIEKKELKYVGGVDISFVKDNPEVACALFLVLEYPSLNVVYSDIRFIKLSLPYIPGFLAFREVPSLQSLIETLKSSPTQSHLVPQVILVDGNGILHPRSFGLASHLGVLVNIPTIGVGKKVFLLDGLDTKEIKKEFTKQCANAGDFIELVGTSKKVWGAALKSHKDSTNPIYVSQGHRLSLSTTIKIVKALTLYRVPEPIRQADLQSRDYIRINYKPTPTTNPNTNNNDNNNNGVTTPVSDEN